MESGFGARMRALPDARLHATLLDVQPLYYAEGANLELDRPAHVRSGSSLHRHRDGLVLVQDDANFIALLQPATGRITTWTLPHGPQARRQFDDTLGNKEHKLDLEAAVILPDDRLLAMGSGSSAQRETMVLLELNAADAQPRLVHAHRFYAALRTRPVFAGSELNVEGAALLGQVIRLFNRGNGAPKIGQVAVNASIDFDVQQFMRYLEDPARAPVPDPLDLRQYELGSLAGLALTFTDASAHGSMVLFTAAAELSPDATRDGPVSGSIIGVLLDDSGCWAPICDGTGAVLPIKVEGIALDPSQPDRAFVIVDPDDPGRPSDFCTVQLDGPWPHL